MARMPSNEEFSGDKRLWFFEIINDKLRTTQRLKLPSEFVKNISEIPDTVALKGPSGEKRHVKVSKKEDGIYLEEGWRQFVRNNSLGKDEFLIFRYSRKQLFDIQIFERTAVERIHVDTNRGHQGCSSSPRKISYDQHPACEPSRGNKTMKGKAMGTSPDGKDKKQTTKTLSKDIHKNQRLPPSEKDRASLQRARESFTSAFPYFCVFMRESYVEKQLSMRIPKAFAREHLAKSGREMILKNSKGKSWKVTSICSSDTKYLTTGWSAFVSANDYKVGDICIFELVAADKFQVHVFR